MLADGGGYAAEGAHRIYRRGTGLYYLRARYYDPKTAQFPSRDPILAVTRPAYLYADDSPVNATDPTGLTTPKPGMDERLVEEARKKYPKKANRNENHHIIDYMGGDEDGPTSCIGAAYHQEITNECCRQWPYKSASRVCRGEQRFLKRSTESFRSRTRIRRAPRTRPGRPSRVARGTHSFSKRSGPRCRSCRRSARRRSGPRRPPVFLSSCGKVAGAVL